MEKPTVRGRIEARLLASGEQAFVRADFEGFGSPRQVGRVLRELSDAGMIVRVGLGIYAKARKSTLTGRPVPAADLLSIGFEALRKLGIDARASRAMKALSDGRSTQVPMVLAIAVDRPVGRKIGFGSQSIVFELA